MIISLVPKCIVAMGTLGGLYKPPVVPYPVKLDFILSSGSHHKSPTHGLR